MERKIERVCVFDTSCEINGFKVYPGNILCKITNEDGKELKFFIESPQYNEGCQLVFARAKDIIDYGFDDLKITISNDSSIIDYIEGAHDDNYVSLNLLLSITEWRDLLSYDQLENLNRQLWNDINFLSINLIKNESDLKNKLYVRQAVLDKIRSMKK